MATAKKAHTPLGLKQDRAKVNSSQPHEIAYVAKKMGVSPAVAKAAAKAAGPSRKAVEKLLKKK